MQPAHFSQRFARIPLAPVRGMRETLPSRLPPRGGPAGCQVVNKCSNLWPDSRAANDRFSGVIVLEIFARNTRVTALQKRWDRLRANLDLILDRRGAPTSPTCPAAPVASDTEAAEGARGLSPRVDIEGTTHTMPPDRSRSRAGGAGACGTADAASRMAEETGSRRLPPPVCQAELGCPGARPQVHPQGAPRCRLEHLQGNDRKPH
jgi:hypothetical protein